MFNKIEFEKMQVGNYNSISFMEWYTCWAEIYTKDCSTRTFSGEENFIEILVFKLRECEILRTNLIEEGILNQCINYNNKRFRIIGLDSNNYKGYVVIEAESINGNI